jgi:hypothetical protein
MKKPKQIVVYEYSMPQMYSELNNYIAEGWRVVHLASSHDNWMAILEQ